ncbi:uncharacterized protein RJT21DRAFT_54925 [Scheffersomyces amazonensis]|uniref:uncharacterized protein n=1 Tax=Scheffersomyces amazonensis TaxID=1078765 RepID=UPI00315DED68
MVHFTTVKLVVLITLFVLDIITNYSIFANSVFHDAIKVLRISLSLLLLKEVTININKKSSVEKNLQKLSVEAEKSVKKLTGSLQELEKSMEKLTGSLEELEISLQKLEISLQKLEISLQKLEISLHKLEMSMHELQRVFVHHEHPRTPTSPRTPRFLQSSFI